jgi:hypothetical protein
MSVSKYKKWMIESYLYEAEKFKARSKESGKIVYYKTKDAMDAAIKDKKAEPIEKGDDKDDKKKPVSIDIDASGGFGDDDKDAGAVSGNNKEVERDKDGVPEDEMDFVDELDDVVDNYKEMKANYEETKKYADPDDPEEKEQMDLDRVEYRKAEDKLRKYRAKAKQQGWDDEEDVHDKLYGDDEPKGDDKPKDKPKYEPSPDDYDAIYGTRSQSGKWQKDRKDEPEEKQSDNDITNLNKKEYSELMDMDIKDLDDAVEEGEREAEQLEPEIDDLVKKHNEEFPKGKRPLALGGQLLPREKQKDPELYDRWKASMDAINEKKKRLESVKSGIDRVKEIADDKLKEEDKNDAISAIESDGVDAIIDKFKESGKEEIYIDDKFGNEHSVVYDDLSPEMQKKLRDKIKPQYDKVKAAQEKMDSLDVDDPGYDDAEQEYESAVDDAGGMEIYDFESMFDFVTERISRKGESIKTINGKKYKAIKESVNKRVTVKEVKSWLKKLEEFRYRKIPGVDVRRIASFVNNGLSETDLPKSLQKKWENAKYSKEKGLADRFMKERINKKLTQNESKHPLKEQYDRLFTNKVVL